MARPKTKESKLRTFRMNNLVGDRLDAYSESSKIPKTTIVEMAVAEYLDRVEQQS